eukprot:scaffold15997_cov55-Phaeocystis_antarctica.AAC.3
MYDILALSVDPRRTRAWSQKCGRGMGLGRLHEGLAHYLRQIHGRQCAPLALPDHRATRSHT